MGKFIWIENVWTSLNGLEKSEMLTPQEVVPTWRTMPGWSGPKDQQNKTDTFLSVLGVMYVIVNSRKSKGKVLKEHILKDIVPRGFEGLKRSRKSINKPLKKRMQHLPIVIIRSEPSSMKTWHCKHKKMYIRPSY